MFGAACLTCLLYTKVTLRELNGGKLIEGLRTIFIEILAHQTFETHKFTSEVKLVTCEYVFEQTSLCTNNKHCYTNDKIVTQTDGQKVYKETTYDLN